MLLGELRYTSPANDIKLINHRKYSLPLGEKHALFDLSKKIPNFYTEQQSELNSQNKEIDISKKCKNGFAAVPIFFLSRLSFVACSVCS